MEMAAAVHAKLNKAGPVLEVWGSIPNARTTVGMETWMSGSNVMIRI